MLYKLVFFVSGGFWFCEGLALGLAKTKCGKGAIGFQGDAQQSQ